MGAPWLLHLPFLPAAKGALAALPARRLVDMYACFILLPLYLLASEWWRSSGRGPGRQACWGTWGTQAHGKQRLPGCHLLLAAPQLVVPACLPAPPCSHPYLCPTERIHGALEVALERLGVLSSRTAHCASERHVGNWHLCPQPLSILCCLLPSPLALPHASFNLLTKSRAEHRGKGKGREG